MTHLSEVTYKGAHFSLTKNNNDVLLWCNGFIILSISDEGAKLYGGLSDNNAYNTNNGYIKLENNEKKRDNAIRSKVWDADKEKIKYLKLFNSYGQLFCCYRNDDGGDGDNINLFKILFVIRDKELWFWRDSDIWRAGFPASEHETILVI